MPKGIYTNIESIPVLVKGGQVECPDVIVKGDMGAELTLEWEMMTKNYKIIDITFADPDSAKEFPIRSGHGQVGKDYKLGNKMTKKGGHKYTITVQDKHSPPIPPLDPMVRNEPD